MAGPAGISRFSGLHGQVGSRTALWFRRAAKSPGLGGGAGGLARTVGCTRAAPGARGGRGPLGMAHRAKSVGLGGCREAALRPSRRSAAGPRAGPQRAQLGLPVRCPRREGQHAVPRSGAPGKARTWPQGRDRARGRLGPLHAPAQRGRFRLPGSRGPTSRPCAAASRGHLAG